MEPQVVAQVVIQYTSDKKINVQAPDDLGVALKLIAKAVEIISENVEQKKAQPETLLQLPPNLRG